MPIRVEISAETIDDLVIHLNNLRRLGLTFAVDSATPTTFREDETAAAITADVVVEEPSAAFLRNAMAAGLTAGIVTEIPKKKRGRPAKVKPLPPEEDDPLAADSGEEEKVEDDTDPFEPEPEASAVDPDKLTPEALIGAATDKLRDLFKLGSAGNEGVRKLREKYGIRYFHEVPPGKAKGLWADALKLETELGA